MSDIHVFKLTTGEELISRVTEETDDSYVLSKPRVVAISPTQSGQMSVTLIPLLASAPDCEFTLSKSVVVGKPTDGINSELEKGYMEQTTGLDLSQSI